jgi:DNA (cytosine-5)-methyltransferase 1
LENGKVLELIINELENCGYQIQHKILDAKYYETPQSRRRMIIVGVKKGKNTPYTYPEPVTYPPMFGDFVTVGDVLTTNPIAENYPNHEVAKLSDLNQERIKHIPQGGAMADCPTHLHNNSDLKRAMRRLDLTKVSPTIVHNNSDHYYHPTEDRRVTIREMARIQGYPDSYIFQGPKSEQSRQVANSVPIPFAYHIAKSVINYLDETDNSN